MEEPRIRRLVREINLPPPPSKRRQPLGQPAPFMRDHRYAMMCRVRKNSNQQANNKLKVSRIPATLSDGRPALLALPAAGYPLGKVPYVTTLNRRRSTGSTPIPQLEFPTLLDN